MNRKLDTSEVEGIFAMRMNGDSLQDIAWEYEISRQYVLNILNREAYKNVPIPERLVNIAANHVNLKAAKAKRRDEHIIALYKTGYAQVEIAKKLKCGTATVCRAVKRYNKK